MMMLNKAQTSTRRSGRKSSSSKILWNASGEVIGLVDPSHALADHVFESDGGDGYYLLGPGQENEYSISLKSGPVRRDVRVTCDMRMGRLNDIIRETMGTGFRVEYTKLPSGSDADSSTLGECRILPGTVVSVKKHESYQIFCMHIGGRTFALQVVASDKVWYLKQMIHAADGVDVDRQRIIFSGKQLQDEQTLHDYNIRNECTVHLILRLRGNVGEWAVAAGLDAPIPRPDGGGVHHARLFEVVPKAIDETTCKALIQKINAHCDNEPTVERDRKFTVPVDVIGADLYERLLAIAAASSRTLSIDLQGKQRPEIILRCRRVLGPGDDLVIPYHLDEGTAVLNVALSTSGVDYGGAVLIFRDPDVEGKQYDVRLGAGDVCVHGNQVVHGVSEMTFGVRYNLFLQF